MRSPPKSARVLTTWVDHYARHHGVAPGRVRNWVSFMILGGALQRAGFFNEGPRFSIKGGVALEMRLRSKARATKDLDLIVAGELGPVEALSEALEPEYQGFTFQVGGRAYTMANRTTRVRVSLNYKGRPWGTVQVDVSLPEAEATQLELVDAIDLTGFGLEGPSKLPCLSLPYHIAQKLHAVTRPSTQDWRNDRFRDLSDLLLMKQWIEDYSVLIDPCRTVFAQRGTHSWPPLLSANEDWEEPYARLARELDIDAVDLQQAVYEVRHMIYLIDKTAPRWLSIPKPAGLTATTWHYAVGQDDSVVRLPFPIGDGLLRGREEVVHQLKPEWLKDPGGLGLIGVVIFLADRKPLFVERVGVHSIAITDKASGGEVAYRPATWNSLAEDLIRRAGAPQRAVKGLSVFLSKKHGELPAVVAGPSGDSTAWMHKLWTDLPGADRPRLVWDLHASTPVEFSRAGGTGEEGEGDGSQPI